MKLPKRVTCTGCGQRKRIRWEVRDDVLSAGYSNCPNCGVGQVHFLGSECMVAGLEEMIKQEVDLFDPG